MHEGKIARATRFQFMKLSEKFYSRKDFHPHRYEARELWYGSVHFYSPDPGLKHYHRLDLGIRFVDILVENGTQTQFYENRKNYTYQQLFIINALQSQCDEK